jgi:hypothetical protein
MSDGDVDTHSHKTTHTHIDRQTTAITKNPLNRGNGTQKGDALKEERKENKEHG